MADSDFPETGPGRPGVMGDGTEEQNLGQEGDPSKRITQDEVEEAFGDEGDDDDLDDDDLDDEEDVSQA